MMPTGRFSAGHCSCPTGSPPTCWGQDPDPALGDVLVDVPPLEMNGSVVERALNAGASVVYLKDRPGSAARSAAVDGLAAATAWRPSCSTSSGLSPIPTLNSR